MEGESVVATSWYLLQSEYTYQPAAAARFLIITSTSPGGPARAIAPTLISMIITCCQWLLVDCHDRDDEADKLLRILSRADILIGQPGEAGALTLPPRTLTVDWVNNVAGRFFYLKMRNRLTNYRYRAVARTVHNGCATAPCSEKSSEPGS